MVYVTGDTHSDFTRFSTDNFPEQKEMTKDDVVIILGDFGGIWEQIETKNEKYWLDWLNNKPFTVAFVDGNHSNFDRLNSEFEEIDLWGGRAHKIRDSVFHLMRGYVFEICGKNFFAFGGASSHDIQDGILDPSDYADDIEFLTEYSIRLKRGDMFRVKGVSWWPEELPSEEEMQRGRESLAAHNNKVDFVITHCLPKGVVARLGYIENDCITKYFDKLLADGLSAKLWFCGHYHINQSAFTHYKGVAFYALYEKSIRVV